jgi:hypothetical protein
MPKCFRSNLKKVTVYHCEIIMNMGPTHYCTKCMAIAVLGGDPSKPCENPPHNFVPVQSAAATATSASGSSIDHSLADIFFINRDHLLVK